MRSNKALLWKEWREVRWFLIAGVAIFVGWPLLEALANYRFRQSFSSGAPEGMVLLFGGAFAIFVAVGVTCRDLREAIACFWQSRPVAIWRWVVTKYMMGLAVVLVVLCVSVAIQDWMAKQVAGSEYQVRQLSNILTCHTFTLILIYSLSFVVGCLIRIPVYAVILSAALALLVYFLPMLVPPLESFSVFNIIMQSPVEIVQLSKLEQGGPWFAGKLRIVNIPWADDLGLRYNVDLLRYIIVTFILSCAGLIVAWAAVKRNWRLKVGQKLMFWLLGGVGMLLFLTVVFQLGSNLKCVRQIPIKPQGEGERGVAQIACDGDKGVFLLRNKKPGDAADDAAYSLMTFDLSAKEPLGCEEIILAKDQAPTFSWSGDRGKIVWSAKNPQWAYSIKTSMRKYEPDGHWFTDRAELLTISLAAGSAGPVDKLDLLPHLKGQTAYSDSLYMLDGTIYASLSGTLFIFDVGIDGKPVLRKIVKERVGISGQSGGSDASGRLLWASMTLRLVDGEGLSVEERLKLTVELSEYRVMASDGDVVVEVNSDFIRAYRLKEVSGDIATLEMTAYRRPTPLERLAGTNPTQVFMRNGLAYVIDSSWDFGGLTVYDVRRPQQIRRVGHYATPNERLLAIAPLQDGNILLGGNKLHIVKPPRAARTHKNGETVGR
jgi:hypothetical protein